MLLLKGLLLPCGDLDLPSPFFIPVSQPVRLFNISSMLSTHLEYYGHCWPIAAHLPLPENFLTCSARAFVVSL